MSPVDRTPSVFFPVAEEADDFTQARLRWLIALRWVAMGGVLVATVLAALGFFPGVAWPLMAAVVTGGCIYNSLLYRSHRAGLASTGRRAAITQALIDLAMLTTVLWAAGGIESPFLGYYIFHVALIAILGGPRATIIAAAAAMAGAGLLSLTLIFPALQIGVWSPVPPWDTLAEVGSFVTMLGTATYIVAHASRELRDREKALSRARDRAALEYQLLSNTLDELEAGLEVVDTSGKVLWRNKGADTLAPWVEAGGLWQCHSTRRSCERDSGLCPIDLARERGETGRCRFATTVDGQERVYEMLSFALTPQDDEPPRVMNLYVDRTEVTLSERRLLLAERLASLGRIAQGVAHELNTPLATIRTLATDMNAALDELRCRDEPQLRAAIVADVGESATLIRDETRRLGRITQALLAGGELVSARISSGVPLAAVVERARALVVAGSRAEVPVIVDASVDGAHLSTDPDRLMQVLVNLVQNAVDAVRAGGGTEVRVRAEPAEDGIRVVVEDDGPGISEHMAGRIFEPFATTKPPGEGTGLGLYTSYMLTQTMGGELQIENREEGGARAIIALPEGAIPVGVEKPVRLSQREPA
jgi:signal transduction histidine kinase